MLDNRTSFYPVIRINRVHLSQTDNLSLKIRIDYSLNLSRPGHRSTEDVITNFLNHRSGRNNVNVSFMVLDSRNESLIADFFKYSTLVTTMMNRAQDDRFAVLAETSGWQQVPLRDALVQSADFESRTTATDMGGETHYETHNFVEFEYHMHELFTNLSPGQSIFQETANTSFVSLEDTTLSQGLHLVAFLEMPYEHFERIETVVPEELRSMPLTEMVYETLLVPTQFGAMRPPIDRKIYFVNDNDPSFSSINNLPYSGPAFFENGIWYAGTVNNLGPKLEIRRVPNTKVSVDAPPLASSSELPHLNHSLFQETGDSLESYIRNNTNTSLFLTRAQMANALVKNSISAMTARKRSFIEPWSYKHTWITAEDDSVEEGLRSSYNCIFGIKYYDLLKKAGPE